MTLELIQTSDYPPPADTPTAPAIFTYHLGLTAPELIEQIRVWLTYTLVPYLDTTATEVDGLEYSVNAALAAFVTEVNAEITATTAALSAEATAAVNAAATALLASVEGITDVAMTGVANTSGSTFTAWLNTHFVQQDATHEDAAVTAALERSGSTSLAYLATLFLGSAPAALDPAMEAAVSGSTHATRDYLDGRYYGIAKNRVNYITGMFHVDEYMAVGDGATDDRAVVQAAIEAAYTEATSRGVSQRVWFNNKHYVIGSAAYYGTGGIQNGVVGLMLHTGVILTGHGTISAASGSYGTGALYGLVRSNVEGISNAGIENLTFDGNISGNVASIQCSNILLECANHVTLDHVKSLNANGNGIMMRGSISAIATDLNILDCYVNNCTAIGIQVSQFNGLKIINPQVSSCTDNGIDLYGENGTTSSSGINFQISNARVAFTSIGIFLETVAVGTVTGGHVNNNAGGFHINRINGEPNKILIASNTFADNPIAGYLTGDYGTGIVITANNMVGCTGDSVIHAGGAGNVGETTITENFMNGTASTLILVASGTAQLSKFVALRNTTDNVSAAGVTNYATSSANNEWDTPMGAGRS